MKKTADKLLPDKENPYKEMNDKVGLNNVSINKELRLTISKACHNHIKSLHTEYPNTEWLAICKTQKVGDWHFMVVDMIHPWQKWVGAEVETTDEGMNWAIDYLKEHNENLADWNLIMHSHHTMGCFWSQTDNNARKGLNDWRQLAWAVVTAYKKRDKTMDIDYKGCVNFYKPYNIEIDCDVDYEEDWWFEKVRKHNKEHKQREEKVKSRAMEIYSNILANEWVGVDFSSINNYLWLDISSELTQNYYMVSRLLPNADKDFYEWVEKKAVAQALEEIPWEDIPSELLQWNERDNMLLKQLEEARKQKVVVRDFTDAYDSKILPGGWKKKEEEETPPPLKEIGDNVDFFNEDNFPEERMLRHSYYIPMWIELYVEADWNWWTYNWRTEESIPFGDYIAQQEQEEDEYQSVVYDNKASFY